MAGVQTVSVLVVDQPVAAGTPGDQLAAGATAGVSLSIGGRDGGSPHAVLHGVLVTQVRGAPAAATDTAAADDPGAAATPSQSLLITLAVTAEEAEPIVFGMEHGTLW